jgi:hypothetical protein
MSATVIPFDRRRPSPPPRQSVDVERLTWERDEAVAENERLRATIEMLQAEYRALRMQHVLDDERQSRPGWRY